MRNRRILASVVNLGAVASVTFPLYHLDLDVYRLGAQAWLRGANLYGTMPPTGQGPRLPFTYPPLSAIGFSPLSLVPMWVAGLLLTSVSVASLLVTLWMFPRATRVALSWALPAALILEPVRSSFVYGQINVPLMALVTVDCLAASPRWPRGALVGLAGALKLAPLMSVLFFLLRRDYRAAATAIASFAVCSGVGYLLAPVDSERYWGKVVFHVERIGGLDYASNQSILGVLVRAGLHPGTAPTMATWLTLSVLVLGLAVLGMRWALAAGNAPLALILNAFAALLISPVSWSHHWVWIAPALLALAYGGYRVGRCLAAFGFVLFLAAPTWWLPKGGDVELHWAVWQQMFGSSYVIFGIAVLSWTAALATYNPNRSTHTRGTICLDTCYCREASEPRSPRQPRSATSIPHSESRSLSSCDGVPHSRRKPADSPPIS